MELFTLSPYTESSIKTMQDRQRERGRWTWGDRRLRSWKVIYLQSNLFTCIPRCLFLRVHPCDVDIKMEKDLQ